MQRIQLATLALLAACANRPDPDCADPGACDDTQAETDDTLPTDSDTDEVADTDGDSDAPQALATCAELGIDTVSLDAATPDAQGRYTVYGRFGEGTGSLSPSCAPGDAVESVVTFTVPSAGAWHFTTDVPGTGTDTTLSLRTACDDLAELACDSRGSGFHGATLVTQAQAGDELVLVVDGAADARGWQLLATPVVGEAAAGDACDDTTPCASGLTCAGEIDPVCIAFDAPTVSSHTAAWANRWDVRHTIEGTDADMDITRLYVVRALTEDGDVWGDDVGEDPIDVPFSALTQQDGAFTAVFDMEVQWFHTFLSPVSRVVLGIEDARGQRVVLPPMDTPEAPEQTQAAAGEACDRTGYPVTCATGSTCQDVGGQATCADPVAPVLSSVTLVQAQGNDIVLDLAGVDVDLDMQRARIQAVQTDGARPYAATAYLTERTTWSGTAFQARVAMSFWSVNGPIDHLEISVRDAAGGVSDVVTVPWQEIPTQILAQGDACDPNDTQIAACDEGLSCSPGLLGQPTCDVPSAPQLFSVSMAVNPLISYFLDVTMEGYDANGDIKSALFSFTGPEGRLPMGMFNAYMAPNPGGKGFFLTTGFLEDVPLSLFTHVEVHLVDDAGLTSNTIRLPLVSELAAGDTCDREGVSQVCAVDGLTCGLAGACETNVEPEVVSVVAHRLNESDVQLDVAFSDPNGDAVDARLEYVFDGVVTQPFPGYKAFDTPIYGQTSGSTTLSLPGLAANTETLALHLAIQDLPGLLGTMVVVDVPGIVEVGGTCSGDDTVDQCADGSACSEGVCTEHAPVADSLDVTFDDHGRTAVFTVTGVDPDRDVSSMRLEADDGLGGTVVWDVRLNGWQAPYLDVVWSGDAFEASIRVPDWGGLDTQALRLATAAVRDARGIASAEVSSGFPTTHALGDTCDASGVDSRCQAGLTCDAGTCVVDTADACAGIDVDNLTDVAAEVDESWIAAFDVWGLDSLTASTCTSAYSRAQMGEAAFVWTAPRDGLVGLSTESVSGDVGVWVTSGSCVQPGEALTCAQNGNTAELDVRAGETLYILLDGFWGTDPSGTLEVAYLD